MKPIAAIRYRLLAVLLGTVMAALIRLVRELPLGELAFFRTFFGIWVLAIVYGWRGELRTALRTGRPFGHFWRGLLGIASMFVYLGAVVRLPLVDVTIISYSAPLITVAMAALILKENVHIYRWSAVIIGFVGTVIMLWPYLNISNMVSTGASLGALMAILSAVMSAGTVMQVRRLTASETTPSIVFYFYVFCAVVSAATLPLDWVSPSNEQWLILVAIAALSALSHILATQAYRYAPTSITASFDYTAIIWAFLIGYFFFGELPTVFIYIGGTIVVASGLFILWQEHRLRIDRKRTVASPVPQL